MKKAIAYILLTLSAMVFLASSIDGLTKLISDWRKTPIASNSWWGSDQYRYGDLYGFSFLPEFRIEQPTGSENIPAPYCDKTYQKNINLFALSDSYTWNVFKNPNNFCGVAKSSFAASNFRDVLPVKLDTTKRNIVIIETTERNVRTLLSDSSYLSSFIHITTPGDKMLDLPTMEKRKQFRLNFRIKDAEANYEFNLWDYRFLTPLKELKAEVTYKWFNRTNPDVAVSPDGKYLLLGTTVDTLHVESSFRPISDRELDHIVAALNGAYNHYKRLGFDDVCLVIIPNPVTVLYPHFGGLKYNRLIPKIQLNSKLKLKVFDCYGLFLNASAKDRLYTRSDTHWTSIGRQLFVNEFNKQLQQYQRPQ